MFIKKRILLITSLFFWTWMLFVLYPNPYRLVVSGYRMIKPATNPLAVSLLVERAPEDPREIEKFVLEEIPYQYDWQTYGMPFYFPTAREAMAQGKGDCKSRFVVLASLFEAKDIAYKQSFSLSHFWVDYEGKEESATERSENAFLLRTEEGVKLQLPKENLKDSFDVLKEGFWDYMPFNRKLLFMMNFPLTILFGLIYNKFAISKF